MSTTAEPASTPGETTTDPELQWLREVYQGDNARQLTVRAIVTGMLLGGFMSLSNLYISLKTGWSFGVTITAGILAFAIFGLLRKARVVRAEFGMLENNAMQSVASAAGYMTGGGTVAAIPALMLATHQTLPWHVMFLWITAIAMLGVFMAIPMKRQMINQEQLKFPSGIAAAETLRGLHAATHVDTSAAGGADKPANPSGGARALLWSGLLGALIIWLREARASWLKYPGLPDKLTFPFSIGALPAARWTIYFDTSPLLLAAGAIMGWRSAWSLAVGSVINYGWLAPYGHRIGAIPNVSYRAIVGWTVWFGSSLLLTSGLLAFAFSWRQIARAFADVGTSFRFGRKPATETTGAGPFRGASVPAAPEDPLAAIEVPMTWFVGGLAVFGPVVIFLAGYFFGIAWWMSLIGVLMSFFIAMVACRATGETDTTPTGALGKITQLVFGVLAPGSVTTNLMTANLTAGVAIHSADLLTDLKSGYLLGAKPRQQFFAQFFGVVAGSAFVVPAFRLLVPSHTVIGTPEIPAPGAVSWNSVAQVMARGISQLPVSARWLILAGSVVGVALVLLERAFPKHKRFIPSATGFGLAFTLSASNSLSMFAGGVIALLLDRYRRDLSDRYVIPVSSGIIAGESLVGILIKVLVIAHVLREAH